MDKGGKTGTVYRIGEIARITGVKAGTIRFYEKCGFVGPVGRSANNYRVYDERHIFQVCRHRSRSGPEIIGKTS